jgi:thymidylate synthase
MKQYLTALEYILANGQDRQDRTGVGTRAVFGYQMRFDLQEGFPAVTTKKLAWKSVVSELLWMIEGSSDERRLAEIQYDKPREELVGKSTIWTANADKQGRELGYTNTDTVKDLGPVYGVQWRQWQARGHDVDQLVELIKGLHMDPYSRRHIISAWNAGEVDRMALPPCHAFAQFYVQDNRLSCQLYQRSADMFLGVPFNIASYSLLTHIIAQILNMQVGEFVWTGGDCHIYKNHFDAVEQQVKRTPDVLPKLKMPELHNLGDVLESKPEDYILIDYNPQESIKAPMAI